MVTKKIIQRNIPINQQYEIIETFYSSIEDSATCCDNCGKLIANICVIKGKDDGKVYHIGMDCADSLTSIKNELLFEKYNFDAAKSARAYILKAIKRAKDKNVQIELTFETFEHTNNFYKSVNSGAWRIEPKNGDLNLRCWKQYPPHQWAKYVLPMIKNITT